MSELVFDKKYIESKIKGKISEIKFDNILLNLSEEEQKLKNMYTYDYVDNS